MNQENFDLRPAIDIFHEAQHHVGSLHVKLPLEDNFPAIKSPKIIMYIYPAKILNMEKKHRQESNKKTPNSSVK